MEKKSKSESRDESRADEHKKPAYSILGQIVTFLTFLVEAGPIGWMFILFFAVLFFFGIDLIATEIAGQSVLPPAHTEKALRVIGKLIRYL